MMMMIDKYNCDSETCLYRLGYAKYFVSPCPQCSKNLKLKMELFEKYITGDSDKDKTTEKTENKGNTKDNK